MKVFSFAQHGLATGMHGYYDILFLQGLAHRGAQTCYYACNGLEICDCTVIGRSLQDCAACIKGARATARKMQAPLFDINDFKKPDDDAVIADWIASLDPERYETARFGRFPIGEWVMSSFHTSALTSAYNYRDSVHVEFLRRYLTAGLRLCLLMSRCLEPYTSDDRIILYNGRMAVSNISRQLGLRKGVPVYLHERGVQYGYRTLFLNGPLYSPERDRRFLDQWLPVPLLKEEIDETTDYFMGREHGDQKILNWHSYVNGAAEDAQALRKRLGIAEEKKVWAVFPSSTDEVAVVINAGKERTGNGDDFESQLHWLLAILALMPRFGETNHFVIRAHPNTKDKERDRAFMTHIATKLPACATLIPADDPTNTYSLMALADVGLAYMSTCIQEMAARGKPVGAGYEYALYYPEVYPMTSLASLTQSMERLADLPRGFRDKEAQRKQFRMTCHRRKRSGVWISLIRQLTPSLAEPAYNSFEEAGPGACAGLDFYCEKILAKEDPVLLPAPADLSRGTEDEEAWLYGAG